MSVAPTPVKRGQAPHRALLLASGILLVLGMVAAAAVLLDHYSVFGSSSTSSTSLEGSGVAATQSRSLPRFSSLELTGSNRVSVRVGAAQAVVVRADDNLIGRVTTEVRRDTLMIGNQPGSFTARTPMSVDVTVRSLEAVTLSGSGTIAVTGVTGDTFTAVISGSGVLTGSGTVTSLAVTVSGSGDAQLDQLTARDVRASLTGSGRILARATDSLDASVPGSGAIVYSGNPPHLTTSITGSGTVMPD